MSRPLGDYDEFAVECAVIERDRSGACRETLTDRLDKDEFALVSFVGDDNPCLVQADVPGWVIDAELDFGPNYRGDSWSVANLIDEAVERAGYRVISEEGSERYYIVSEAETDA
jgi:hypothetical protein